jgi:hypothetical protein
MFTLVRKSISLVASRERHGKKKINFCHFTGCLHDREEDCCQDFDVELEIGDIFVKKPWKFFLRLNFRRQKKEFLKLSGFQVQSKIVS